LNRRFADIGVRPALEQSACSRQCSHLNRLMQGRLSWSQISQVGAMVGEDIDRIGTIEASCQRQRRALLFATVRQGRIGIKRFGEARRTIGERQQRIDPDIATPWLDHGETRQAAEIIDGGRPGPRRSRPSNRLPEHVWAEDDAHFRCGCLGTRCHAREQRKAQRRT